MVSVERRLATLLLVLGLIAVPAVALRAFCVGNSCDAAEERTDPVPFCSLDRRVRDLVTAGFYEGRSPDVLGVTGATAVTSHAPRSLDVPWPSTSTHRMDVPVAFIGPAFGGTELSSELGLDQIAPTLAPLLGFVRPFPDVRSGRAIGGAVAAGASTRLAVIVVWRGVGMPELEDTTGPLWLLDVMAGAGTADARGVAAGLAQPGSLPLDPAAIVTTIGTGGLPSQHGITGTVLGTDHRFTRAFARGAPGTVIATLGDDLDEATQGGALVGLVAADSTDRGLIGQTWYGGEDDDTVVVGRRDPLAAVTRLLDQGWGAGGAPDLLGVTLVGDVESMDATTRRIVEEVQVRVPDAAIAVTATGSLAFGGEAIDDRDVARRVDITLPAAEPVIAGSAPGGYFLDTESAAAQGVTTQQVADAMASQMADDLSTPLFDDTFPSFTVRFGRYC